MSHPLDLSYMGIYTIWTNKLGKFLSCTGRTHACTHARAGWNRSTSLTYISRQQSPSTTLRFEPAAQQERLGTLLGCGMQKVRVDQIRRRRDQVAIPSPNLPRYLRLGQSRRLRVRRGAQLGIEHQERFHVVYRLRRTGSIPRRHERSGPDPQKCERRASRAAVRLPCPSTDREGRRLAAGSTRL